MLPKCSQRCRVSIVSAVTAGDIGVGDGDLEQHRVRQTASLCEIEWASGNVATPIALSVALSFSFALSATLYFKRGLPVGRTRTDLEGLTSAVVPFYASTRSHFMLQVTLRTERVCVPRYAACRSYKGIGSVPPVKSANAGSSECNRLPADCHELLRGAGMRGSACT